MRIFRVTFLFFCCFAGVVTNPSSPARAASGQLPITWETLESGLDLARITLQLAVPAPFAPPAPAPAQKETPAQYQENAVAPEPEHSISFTAQVSVLRIKPAEFSFSLYMASEKGRKAMADICRDENFIVAINAGMFLPDRMTSTGYLRQGAHVNNNRVAANFGSFFVAAPADPDLPQAKLVDRSTEGWQKALEEYSLVMQNYRMTTPAGRIIWKQTEKLHSIAALSQDNAGNILFIFCPDPVPPKDFMAAFLSLPLQASSVMYLEGGSEAALIINTGNVFEMQTGRHVSGLWSGGARLEIPNVLGVKRKPK